MKLVLVGAGGYGQLYVNYLLRNPDLASKIEGIVDKNIENCPAKDAILSAGIPIYHSLSEFYREHEADLAIICTPSFLHCEQTICALQNNSHVLCEKPIAPAVRDAERMLQAEKKYGKFVAIGYQWSFSEAIQNLKKDILEGKLGKPRFLKTIIIWPRDKAYYQRGGGWAGKISMNNIPIFDSIASNACAHYLHNMFFLLGADMNSSMLPVMVEAECLKANDIETFDTCVFRMHMENRAQLYFAATHAADTLLNPQFIYEFDHATVEFKTNTEQGLLATFRDGTVINYGNPFQNDFKKVHDCIKAIENNDKPICTVKTALPHVQFIEKLHEHIHAKKFPNEVLKEDHDRVSVPELYNMICSCYSTMSLLSETNVEYAEKKSFIM